MPSIKLHDNASIISAVPALLGFTPRDSIILMLLKEGDTNDTLSHLLRFDIDTAAAANVTTAAAPVFHGATAAVLIAVCGDWNTDRAAETLDVLRDQLANIDLPAVRRLITPDIDQPGAWTDIDTGEHGPLAPYRDSIFAANRVYHGADVTADRADIVAEFTTPITNPVPVIPKHPVSYLADTFDTIAAIISGTAHPATHPDLATRAGILLTHSLDMRDAMLLLCIDHPEQAADLWARIANQLTGPARIEALTISGACHYAAADTVRAGIALDVAAQDALTAHIDYPRLAQLLLTALSAGISPTEIREFLSSVNLHAED